MKAGDYVRTKSGLIFKIIDGNEDNWVLDIDYSILEYYDENWLELYKYNDNHSFFTKSNIIKSSPNIIDLIEDGDYVNGHKVFDDMRVDTDDYGNDFREIGIEIDNMLNHYIREEDIKSIVTKEQFESMEYKVVE